MPSFDCDKDVKMIDDDGVGYRIMLPTKASEVLHPKPWSSICSLPIAKDFW